MLMPDFDIMFFGRRCLWGGLGREVGWMREEQKRRENC